MAIRVAGISILAVAALVAPFLASATTLLETLGLVNTFLNISMGLLITLAIVVFFWGLVQYIFNPGTDQASRGIQTMFWGVLAIFVMVSIWGIIRLLQATFKVQSTDPIVPKGIQINTRGY